MLKDDTAPKPHRADQQQQKLSKQTLKRTPSFLSSLRLALRMKTLKVRPQTPAWTLPGLRNIRPRRTR